MTAERHDLLGETLRDLESRSALRSAEPRLLADLRNEAGATLRARGFPTLRDEAWRFTDVRPIVGEAFAETSERSVDHAALSQSIPPVGSLVWIENGSPGPGKTTVDPGVEICSLGDALRRVPDRIEPHLGRIVRPDTGFSAQNTAMFDEALVVLVAAGVDAKAPLHLVLAHWATKGPTASYPRILVVLGPSSKLSLVETHVGQSKQKYLENTAVEVALGDRAELDHVRIHSGHDALYSIATTSVLQSSGSRYRARTFTFGGALTRIDLHTNLDGEGAECSLDGLYVARGTEHVDHHTLVEHPTPRALSRQRYKGILDESSTGVFDGIVLVHRGAEKTRAHQENRNLLLSGGARVHAKPHLEIDADDVQCSHGATVGRLDPEQLFYLRSRGIDEPTGRAALTYAFARELIDSVPDADLRRFLARSVASRLPRGNLAETLS